MFAQRHIFFRLRAFISGCLAALDAAPPFPARVMPMEIGISFSCPKKKRSGSACSARSHGLGLRPTNVRLAARLSPSL
jgi:hypothetical protein